MGISAAVITYNEEDNIRRFLDAGILTGSARKIPAESHHFYFHLVY